MSETIVTKKCIKCETVKSIDKFIRNKSANSGWGASCKVCANIRNMRLYNANRVLVSKQRKTIYDSGKHRITNSIKNEQWRQANLEHVKERQRIYYIENKIHHLARSKKWRETNLDHCKAYEKSWRKNNPDLCAAKRTKRRAGLIQATPIWYELEKEAIQKLYLERKGWVDFGVNAHVDHIVPLKHPLVCGLHTLANLQVITARDNLMKSNKFKID